MYVLLRDFRELFSIMKFREDDPGADSQRHAFSPPSPCFHCSCRHRHASLWSGRLQGYFRTGKRISMRRARDSVVAALQYMSQPRVGGT